MESETDGRPTCIKVQHQNFSFHPKMMITKVSFLFMSLLPVNNTNYIKSLPMKIIVSLE